MTEYDADVIIAGYGPTGQALASLLARQGHSVSVFERWPGLYGLPRLCTLDGESARIVQAAGDIDHALADSNPCLHYYLLNEDGQVIMHMDWTEPHVTGFPSHISMHQPDIEDAMDGAARERGAKIYQGWDVVSVDQDQDKATVRVRKNVFDENGEPVREVEAAQERVLVARYVVGADGARSAIRTALGIEREHFPFRNAWLSLDAIRKRTLPSYHNGIADDLRVPIIVCAPEGRTHAAIPIGYNRLRFEFLVDPDSDHTENLSPAVGYEHLAKFYGLTEDDVELYRQVIYPFEGAIATKWRAGRVLLAGDAAHLMTPFLGQGACSGLRDSANLAWKLGLVLSKRADETLLDTYQLERLPHVTAAVAGSDMVGAMACEPDPEKAAQRDAFLLSGQAPPPPGDPVLEQGILAVADGRKPEPPIGDLAPQGTVRDGITTGRSDDVIGWGFQLVLRDENPRARLTDQQAEFFQSIGGHLVGVGKDARDGVVADVDGTFTSYLERHGISGYLMRPDFYVFGVIKASDDVGRVVDALQQQLGATVPVSSS